MKKRLGLSKHIDRPNISIDAALVRSAVVFTAFFVNNWPLRTLDPQKYTATPPVPE
jgi:hypothetical protein